MKCSKQKENSKSLKAHRWQPAPAFSEDFHYCSLLLRCIATKKTGFKIHIYLSSFPFILPCVIFRKLRKKETHIIWSFCMVWQALWDKLLASINTVWMTEFTRQNKVLLYEPSVPSQLRPTLARLFHNKPFLFQLNWAARISFPFMHMQLTES